MSGSGHPQVQYKFRTTLGQEAPFKFQSSSPEPQFDLNKAASEIGDRPTGNRVGRAFESIWSTLSPYLTADLVCDSPNRMIPKRQNMTVLSADMRGFTSLAEHSDPEDCLNLLNEYFCMAVESVFDFNGVVDKFQGDGFMATFSGDHDGESHERRAVRCALRLRDLARCLNLPQSSGNRIPLGIGVNTGIAAVGNVGSQRRKDYTAIGDVVNVAHHLQHISEPDQIIVSEDTRRGMGHDLDVETLGYIRVKGRVQRVEAFLVG
jgi:adenylate cyclase